MVSFDPDKGEVRLAELLARVERGEEVEIVRAGRVVARVVPASRLVGVGPAEPREGLFARMDRFRANLAPRTFDVRALIDEGRR